MNHAKQSRNKENDKIPVHFSFCCVCQVLRYDAQHHKLLNQTPEWVKQEDQDKIPGKRQAIIHAAIKNRNDTRNEYQRRQVKHTLPEILFFKAPEN